MRATLLGNQAGRIVCRDRLLDLFVALSRLRTPDGKGYIVDSVDDCNSNVGSSVNVKLLKPMDFKPNLEEDNKLDSEVAVEEENNIGGNTAHTQEGVLTKGEGKELLKSTDCDEGEAVANSRSLSEDSEEDLMMSLQSALRSENVANPEPLSPRYVDTYNDDLEKLREAVSKKRGQSEVSEEEMLSLQNALGSKVRLTTDQELGILGYLTDSKGESHPMADGSLIGRDPQCQLCLPSKTVSRKHAKIFSLEDGGAALQLLTLGNKVQLE